jgi:tRNA modification GTPase
MQTLVACLTPPGKSAIATIAVRGPQAWPITRQLFEPRSGTLPDEPEKTRHWLGRLGIESRDEVILAVKETSPFAMLELHCHGGVAVVRMICDLYAQHSAQVVSWRTYLGDNLQIMLAQAPTTRTASILLDQTCIDWPKLLEQASAETRQRLQELIPLGRHLIEPWRVVIAGPPNVGKSSLMNALAGYTRSVVSPTPGTTRDVVTARLAIDGWPIEMIDTAGLRQAPTGLEQQGIQRARAALEQADLRLWLLDGSTVAPILPDEKLDWCYIINKTDLPSGWDCQQFPDALSISARTGAGIAELCALISHYLVPHPPGPGEAVPWYDKIDPA